MASLPAEKNVGRAKAAQALRLGQSGAFGKRKRCVKGNHAEHLASPTEKLA